MSNTLPNTPNTLPIARRPSHREEQQAKRKKQWPRRYSHAGNPSKTGGPTYWHGMSVWELSSVTGVNKSTISRIKNGVRRPSVDVLARLASAFGMPIERLIEELNALRDKDKRTLGMLRKDWRAPDREDYAPPHPGAPSKVARDAANDANGAQPDALHAKLLATHDGRTVDDVQSDPLPPGN